MATCDCSNRKLIQKNLWKSWGNHDGRSRFQAHCRTSAQRASDVPRTVRGGRRPTSGGVHQSAGATRLGNGVRSGRRAPRTSRAEGACTRLDRSVRTDDPGAGRVDRIRGRRLHLGSQRAVQRDCGTSGAQSRRSVPCHRRTPLTTWRSIREHAGLRRRHQGNLHARDRFTSRYPDSTRQMSR